MSAELLDPNTANGEGVVWLVGQCKSWLTQRWEFQGVFATREEALAICRENYFVYPIRIGEAAPHESRPVPADKVLWPCGVDASAYEGRKIICLCGSTRFMEAFHAANLRETLAGNIVLTIGCDTKSDTQLMLAGVLSGEVKARLDELHLRKVDLADEVLILNVGGYIGDSTARELAYARAQGKAVRFLEPQPEGDW